VPRPSAVPVFYRNAVNNVMQTERLEVLGPDTSGEVEPVVVVLDDGMWIGLGSDHTDRKAETMGIALSKQLCGKVMGSALWRLEDISEHWDGSSSARMRRSAESAWSIRKARSPRCAIRTI
jgi:hypothetical protein